LIETKVKGLISRLKRD